MYSLRRDRIKLFKTKQINSHALCIMQNIDHVYFFIECLTSDNLQYCHSVFQFTFNIT